MRKKRRIVRSEQEEKEKKKETLARLTLNERNLFSDLKFSAVSTIYVHNRCMPADGYSYMYTQCARIRKLLYNYARIYTFAMLPFARKREK